MNQSAKFHAKQAEKTLKKYLNEMGFKVTLTELKSLMYNKSQDEIQIYLMNWFNNLNKKDAQEVYENFMSQQLFDIALMISAQAEMSMDLDKELN